MSSEELSGDSSDSGPESVNFDDENLKSSKIPGKQKSTDSNYMSWTFHDSMMIPFKSMFWPVNLKKESRS